MKINELSVLLMELSFNPSFDEEIKVINYIKSSEIKNEQDYEGRTLLMNAACYGLNELLKYLISEDFLINTIDFQGRSALHLAVINEQVETSKLLIESGIDLELVDYFKHKAIDYATTNKSILDIFTNFLEI